MWAGTLVTIAALLTALALGEEREHRAAFAEASLIQLAGGSGPGSPELSDRYLPPPPSSGYLPPPPPEQHYLPPPPPNEYLPPTLPNEEYLPPPPSEEYLPPNPAPPAQSASSGGSSAGGPSGSAEEELGLSAVVMEAAPDPGEGTAGQQETKDQLQQSVVLELDSSVHGGFCPRLARTRSCLPAMRRVAACFTDLDCPQHQKCCSKNCELRCVDAVTKPRSCDDMVCGDPDEMCVDLETGPTCQAHSKPGQCPFHDRHCSNRILICEDDSQCEGDQLCCNIGCHRLCVNPVSAEAHAGFCPEALSKAPTRCGTQCTADSDCDDRHKCCENACGSVCRPGVVPFITCENLNCPPRTECRMQGLEAVCRDVALKN